MLDNLYDLIKDAQNKNTDATLKVINKFSPLIKKYSRKLNYDGADSDLIICLIEIINKIPIIKNKNMANEGVLVSYISNSLYHKYIYLSKKYTQRLKMETTLNEEILNEQLLIDIESEILLNTLLDNLPVLQRKILKECFFNNKTCSELAEELNVSRQSINQAKNRALNNLKKYLF